MNRMKLFLAVMVFTVSLAVVPAAHAACPGAPGSPCVHFLGSGSSALFQATAVAAANDLAHPLIGIGPVASVHHFTTSSTTCNGGVTACASLKDSRAGVPSETSTFWAVYTCTTAPGAACTAGTVIDIWGYNQVDSVVGVRTFLARPAVCAAPCHKSATTLILSGTLKASVGVDFSKNLINQALFNDGVGEAASGATAPFPAACSNTAPLGTNCDDKSLPDDVYTAIHSVTPLTAGLTDIRPEDAKFATVRIQSTVANGGLGYATASGVSTPPIKSAIDTSVATPVDFALPGFNDPVDLANGTTVAVPNTMTVVPIGESPVIFITNRTNSTGLGTGITTTSPFGTPLYDNVISTDHTYVNGAAHFPLADLFGGGQCDGNSPAFGVLGGAFPVDPIIREPLSGTMNTTEFSVFRQYGGITAPGKMGSIGVSTTGFAPAGSQENNLTQPGDNPVQKACGLGTRFRAIGTGQEVGTVKSNPKSGAVQDNIGYTFFSFGNIATLSATGTGTPQKFGYLKLDGTDGIFGSYLGGDPGQPAGNAGPTPAPGPPGQVPACVVDAGSIPNIPTCGLGLWTGGIAGTGTAFSGTNTSFPHLQDGTYRAWSLLRGLCDSDPLADKHCLTSDDSLGAQGLLTAAANDIDKDTIVVPDFLPVHDIKFIRAHYAFVGTGTNGGMTPQQQPGTHTKPAGVSFKHGSVPGGFPALPDDLPSDASLVSGSLFGDEAGGDAGGCIIPAVQGAAPTGGEYPVDLVPVAGQVSTAVTGGAALSLAITHATNANAGTKINYTYTYDSVSDPANVAPFGCGNNAHFDCNTTNTGAPTGFTAIQRGQTISVVGATTKSNNGAFVVTKTVSSGATGGTVKVATSTAGFTEAEAAHATIGSGCAQ